MNHTILGSVPRRCAAVCLGALLSLTGLVATVPTPATADALPCSPGVPVPGDYNGDGSPEALVSQHTLIGIRVWSVRTDGSAAKVFVQPSGYNLDLRNADLNGDLCSDVIVTTHAVTADSVRLILGTRAGLKSAPTVALTLPQLGQHTDQTLRLDPVIGSRHHGISQVVATVHLAWPENGSQRYASFLNVYTLEASGEPGTPQVIEAADVGSEAFGPVESSGASLAVGATQDTVNGHEGAGAVLMFTFDAANPGRPVFRTRITQDSPGVPDTAETGDGFGTSLSFRDGVLAVGIPEETIGRARNTGQVQPIRWDETTLTYTAYRAINQNTPGMPGSNQSYDRLGRQVLVTRGLTANGSHDIVFSWHDRSLGEISTPSRVVVANAARSIYRGYTQRTPGVSGLTHDFGESLTFLATSPTVDTLLVGSPGATVDDCAHSGRLVRSNGTRLTRTPHWLELPSPGCENQWWSTTIAR